MKNSLYLSHSVLAHQDWKCPLTQGGFTSSEDPSLVTLVQSLHLCIHIRFLYFITVHKLCVCVCVCVFVCVSVCVCV